VDTAQLLRAVRRRWLVVAAAVAIALTVGWLTTRIVPTGPPVRNFNATSVLLSTTNPYTSGGGYYNLRTIAALTTVGEVPERVAETLQYSGDPLELAAQVKAMGNPETALLRISATSTDPEEARVLANTFATELVTFLNDRSAVTSSREAETLEERINRLEQEIGELDRQIGSNPSGDELLVAQRDAKVRQYGILYERLQQLSNVGATVAGSLHIIQDAVPFPLPDQGFIQVRSWPTRLLLAAILGLLTGVGIVFLLERFDTRINTKEEAERSFDLPVLAEIPLVRRWRKGRSGIAASSEPKSHAADAFRLLGAGVMRRPPQPPQTILITGPGPGDGKTTVTANLAATFAEVGKKVLVLSCDLHRPTIHTLFGIPNVHGLTEALTTGSDNGQILDGQKWRTGVSNVRVVPSGATPEKPGELLSSSTMKQVLAEARGVADIVLLDTAPILAASDVTHLLPLVDAVLVVARAGQTTEQAAERTTEVLKRLGAPVVGTVLNGATEAVLPRGYYQYYQTTQRRQSRSTGLPEPSGPRKSG
jgi:capsular exopolysaccharide synthesis family protein